MSVKAIKFDIKGDSLGYLIALESNKNVPFEIKRAYFIYDIAVSDVRGMHAHKKLRQMLACIRGTCKVRFDDNKDKWAVEMDKPHKGVLIDPMVWHEMYDFSPDCLLMVVADDFYDENDYIRNYEEFCKHARK